MSLEQRKRIVDLAGASPLIGSELLALWQGDAVSGGARQASLDTLVILLDSIFGPDIAAKIPLALMGAADGVATLDGAGKLTGSQIPAALLGAVNWQGTWNATTNTPAIPAAAAANKGYFYKVSVAGTTNIDGIAEWAIGDWIISNGTVWEKVDNTDQVLSVAGLTGTITAAGLKTALAIAAADLTDFSANARSLVTAANYAAMKVLLAITAADITNASANGRSLITAADYAAMKVLLAYGSAADKNIGTSGNNVPLLDGANTHSGARNTFTKFINVGAGSAKTIAAGEITADASYIILDTEAGAATDDLIGINGGSDGDIIILRTANSARDVVLKNLGGGTNPLSLNGSVDATLASASNRIIFIYNVTTGVWIEVSRSF